MQVKIQLREAADKLHPSAGLQDNSRIIRIGRFWNGSLPPFLVDGRPGAEHDAQNDPDQDHDHQSS